VKFANLEDKGEYMSMQFSVSDIFKTDVESLYHAWLDSRVHSDMTGGKAEVSNVEKASFTAWDGYISGSNVSLVPHKRIVQHWRTTEFSDDEPDSLIEVEFSSEETGTRVTIHHSQLPPHGMQYKQGWVDAYFTPMHAYFK